MIKYKSAYNDNNEIIHIDSLGPTVGRNSIYHCISCNNQLIPKLGEVRQKHFAHKHSNQNINCSVETYLHSIAKRILFDSISEKIKNNKPLSLQYGVKVNCEKCHFPESNFQNCQIDHGVRSINLLDSYKSVEIEKQFDNYRPDICLYNDNDQIFIEIVVSHSVDEIKMQSKNKIIEIYIEDEDQLKHLKNEQINNDNYKTNIYNFNFQNEYKVIKKEKCKKGNLTRFVVFNNGKSRIKELTFYEEEDYKVKRFYLAEVNKEKYNESQLDEYARLVEEAYNNKIKIKNCHLCRYHGYKFFYGFGNKIFCKYYKRIIYNSNDASACEIYRADKKAFYSEHMKN